MDGVLVDIKDIHFHTLNDALESIDKKYVISYDKHLSTFDGLKTIDKLNILTQSRGLPREYHTHIWTIKQQKTIEYIKKLEPNPHILSVLKSLKDLGLTIAVASNSIRETIKHVLLSTRYMEYIDFFLSNEDVRYSKPSSEIYLQCMIKAGVSPKETIIFEDSPLGIKAAQNTGAMVMQVKNTNDINESIIDHIQSMSTPIHNTKWVNKKLNIVIPMAGAGSRFEQAGYTFPKPLIDVNGEPMIKVVIDNLNVDANYTFIVQNVT